MLTNRQINLASPWYQWIKVCADVRREGGESQAQIAGRMGVSVSLISALENGKQCAHRSHVLRYAKALGLNENSAIPADNTGVNIVALARFASIGRTADIFLSEE